MQLEVSNAVARSGARPSNGIGLSNIEARLKGLYGVNIMTARRTWLHRETLKSLCERLDPTQFLQVHRSTIVAVTQVRAIERGNSGAQLRLADGSLTAISARYLSDVERVLGL